MALRHIATVFVAGWRRVADWIARGQLGPAYRNQCCS